MQLDHSVRTVKEAAKVADSDIKAALGLLDARFVAGDEALFDQAGRAVTRRLAVEGRATGSARSRRSSRERHDDAPRGRVRARARPQERAGGTRDLTILGVLAQVTPVYEPDPALDGARETLLEVRGRAAAPVRPPRTPAARVPGRGRRGSRRRRRRRADGAGLRCRRARSPGSPTTPGAAVRSWREGPRGRSRRGRDRDARPRARAARRRGRAHRRRRRRPTTRRSCSGPRPPRPTRACRSPGRPCGASPRSARATIGRWTDAMRDAFVSLLGAGEPMVEQVELARPLRSRSPPSCPSGSRSAAARSATRSTSGPSTATCSRRCRSRRSTSATCTAPTSSSSARCCTTSARACPATTPTTASTSPSSIATRMGFAPDDVAVLVELVRLHLLLPSRGHRSRPRRPRHHRRGRARGRLRRRARAARRAHRGRLARHRTDRVVDVEGRAARPARRRDRARTSAGAARGSTTSARRWAPRRVARPSPRFDGAACWSSRTSTAR